MLQSYNPEFADTRSRITRLLRNRHRFAVPARAESSYIERRPFRGDEIVRNRCQRTALLISITAVLCAPAAWADGPEAATLDGVYARVASPDNKTVYVTGNYYIRRGPLDHGFPIMVTQAQDAATGEVDWEAGTWGPSGLAATGRAVAVSPDGTKVFATGYTDVCLRWESESYPHECLETSGAFHTVAYDAELGTTRWETSLPGFTLGAASVAVGPSGERAFVTGSMAGDYYTVAYDVASGEAVWSAQYDGPASLGDRPGRITVSPDGSTVFVAGAADIDRANPAGKLTVVAYDAVDGSERWAVPQKELAAGAETAGPVASILDAVRLR
jgi:outer membrane protein assembly factor BamB